MCFFSFSPQKNQCGTFPIPMYECSFLSSPNEPKINAGGKQETLTTCTGLTFKQEFFSQEWDILWDKCEEGVL